jgi:hypothetical protein
MIPLAEIQDNWGSILRFADPLRMTVRHFSSRPVILILAANSLALLQGGKRARIPDGNYRASDIMCRGGKDWRTSRNVWPAIAHYHRSARRLLLRIGEVKSHRRAKSRLFVQAVRYGRAAG